MIDGLKLAIPGEELILTLNERIARYRSTIQFQRDLMEGKLEPPQESYWEVPAETVVDEIRRQEHRIDLLSIIRDHILTGETYLVGRLDLAFAELLPYPPEPVEWDPLKQIRWVPQFPQVERSMPFACSPALKIRWHAAPNKIP